MKPFSLKGNTKQIWVALNLKQKASLFAKDLRREILVEISREDQIPATNIKVAIIARKMATSSLNAIGYGIRLKELLLRKKSNNFFFEQASVAEDNIGDGELLVMTDKNLSKKINS